MELITSFAASLTPTQWLSVMWVVIAGYGLIVNINGYREAREDYKWLLDSGLNGFRAIIAKGNIRHEIIRSTIQVVFMVIGILVFIDFDFRAWVSAACFILAAILMVYNSFMDYEDRKRLIGYRKKEGKTHLYE